MSACQCSYLCSCASSVCLSLNTSFVRILVSSFLDPRVPWQLVVISSGLVNVWHLRRTERLLAHTAETLFFRALSFSGFLQAFHAGIILHKLRSGPRWKLLLYLWLNFNFKWGDTRSLSIFLAVFPTNMWPQSIFHHKVSILAFSNGQMMWDYFRMCLQHNNHERLLVQMVKSSSADSKL